jgi:hypothetical protein
MSPEHLAALRVIVYGPFVLSLLGLLPKSRLGLAAKIREVLPSESETLAIEVEKTFELVGRLDRLIEVSVFDILYAYLNLLLTLWERDDPVPRSNAFVGVVALLVYHVILLLLGSRLYKRYDTMHYGDLREVLVKVFGLSINGKLLLSLFSFAFVVLAALFTLISRKILTGQW